MQENGVVREGKWITPTILNEDMDDVIRIIKSLKKSNIVIDGGSKTVKHKIKIQEGGFMCVLLGSLGGSIIGNILNKK